MTSFKGETIHSETIIATLKKTLQLKEICRNISYQKIIDQAIESREITVTPEEIQAEADHIRYENRLFRSADTFAWLNDYLQNRPNLTDEILVNPVLPTEFFNRHWNQDRYSNFRNKISNYNTWINDAYEESDINEAVKKWRKIFGEDFGEIQKTMASFSAYQSFDVKASRHDSRINQEEFISEQFPMNLDDRWSLKIAVSPDRSSGGFRPYVYRKNEGLTFMVNRNKSNLPQGIFFKWKVKNSGSEAKRYNAMRGQLENDKGDGVKFEWTLYKGKHYVECYAIYRDSVVATDSVYINVV